MQAYYQNRTVIFKDQNAPNLNRLSDVYLPFSNCVYESNENAVDIPGYNIKGT